MGRLSRLPRRCRWYHHVRCVQRVRRRRYVVPRLRQHSVWQCQLRSLRALPGRLVRRRLPRRQRREPCRQEIHGHSGARRLRHLCVRVLDHVVAPCRLTTAPNCLCKTCSPCQTRTGAKKRTVASASTRCRGATTASCCNSTAKLTRAATAAACGATKFRSSRNRAAVRPTASARSKSALCGLAKTTKELALGSCLAVTTPTSKHTSLQLANAHRSLVALR